MSSLGKFVFSFCIIMLAGPFAAFAQEGTFSDAFAGFASNNNEPVEIEAQKLEVQDKDKTAIFTGTVVVTQGTSTLKTEKLVVYYKGSVEGEAAPQQSISRLEAFGDVLISSKDQVATGDQASFDMVKEFMVMTGDKVVLTQGKNVIVGKKITVNLKTGRVNMDASQTGRVKLLLQPNSAPKK
ncbi:lipopolysaccharide transport periplasmic protein LptA [Polycladidibacter stylochi]|uniref:lipopolysaccharide transport periplasmic protein LptA n=1 Tax=Polycladidibacter stylochi TaxID=1807766 RepID=UPI0009E861C6|nr:lipopolysaccharide transport periplasmic protein LptA [Pseudovibrio stylochi]